MKPCKKKKKKSKLHESYYGFKNRMVEELKLGQVFSFFLTDLGSNSWLNWPNHHGYVSLESLYDKVRFGWLQEAKLTKKKKNPHAPKHKNKFSVRTFPTICVPPNFEFLKARKKT